jgi:hypothetical protein
MECDPVLLITGLGLIWDDGDNSTFHRARMAKSVEDRLKIYIAMAPVANIVVGGWEPGRPWLVGRHV